MINKYSIKLIIFFSLVIYIGCNKTGQGPKIFGCTDSNACNYDIGVNENDGSCYYKTTLLCYNDEDGDGFYNDSQESSQEYMSCDVSCSDLGDTWSDDLIPVPKVTLSASPTSVAIAETFNLDIIVANIENLFAISFKISFNPNILEIDMESESVNYDVFTNENFGPVVYSDNNGMLSVALGGNDINGKIFSVTIQGKISGTTDIELNKVNLIQNNGMSISNYNALILENVVMTVIQSE